MSDVRVTIGANSAPLQSEFEKVKRSAQGLKHSIGETGGILEGDRRVENKMTAWVEGFKDAKNGADLLANTMGNLGDVFKSSLAIGVGLNVGAALVGMIGEVIAKADELHKSAKAAGEELRKAMESGDSGKLESSIKKANEEIDKLAKKASGLFGAGAALDKSELFKQKLEAGAQYVELAQQELEIQRLITDGQLDEADALTEKLRLKKEIAAIDELQLVPSQRNEAVGTAIDASEERLEKKRDERRAEREKKEEEAAQQILDDNEKAILEEGELRGKLIEARQEREAKERADREKGEKETAASIASFYVNKEKEKWQAILDVATQARKKLDEADKAALEKKQGDLKNAEALIKKGADQQRQSDNDKVQGILAGESLVMQRANKRVKDAAYEKAAGIAARDEVRNKLGKDAAKMATKDAKDQVEAVKKRMLGDKPLSEKEIAAAAKAIPEMQKDIAKLVAKLGVK